jgi:hypothetical protein
MILHPFLFSIFFTYPGVNTIKSKIKQQKNCVLQLFVLGLESSPLPLLTSASPRTEGLEVAFLGFRPADDIQLRQRHCNAVQTQTLPLSPLYIGIGGLYGYSPTVYALS